MAWLVVEVCTQPLGGGTCLVPEALTWTIHLSCEPGQFSWGRPCNHGVTAGILLVLSTMGVVLATGAVSGFWTEHGVLTSECQSTEAFAE